MIFYVKKIVTYDVHKDEPFWTKVEDQHGPKTGRPNLPNEISCFAKPHRLPTKTITKCAGAVCHESSTCRMATKKAKRKEKNNVLSLKS